MSQCLREDSGGESEPASALGKSPITTSAIGWKLCSEKPHGIPWANPSCAGGDCRAQTWRVVPCALGVPLCTDALPRSKPLRLPGAAPPNGFRGCCSPGPFGVYLCVFCVCTRRCFTMEVQAGRRRDTRVAGPVWGSRGPGRSSSPTPPGTSRYFIHSTVVCTERIGSLTRSLVLILLRL